MATNEAEQQVVVVGVDGSEQSVAALKWAARYAAKTGAAIRAVLAWHYPTAAGQPPIGTTPESARHETEEVVLQTLDSAVRQVFPDRTGSPVQARISYGHPAQVLIDRRVKT